MDKKKWMRVLWPGFAVAAVALALVFAAGPGNRTQSTAALQTFGLGSCMGDMCGSANCTAKDMSVTAVNTYDVVDPCQFEGDTGTYYFRAEFDPQASKRYDLGVWIATDGGDAETGACWHDYLIPPLVTTGLPSPPTPFVGPPYWDLEENGDQCGDVLAGQVTSRIVGPVTIQCTAANLDGTINTCAAWDNNSENNCPANNNCAGTPAKCRCAEVPFEVNLNVVDLELEKQVSAESVLPGDEFQYTVRVTNNSSEYTSTGYVVTDDLDDSLRYVSGPDYCEASSAYGATVSCHVEEDLAPTEWYEFTFTVQLDPNYLGPETIPNTACVQGFEVDPDETNNCDDVEVPTSVELAWFTATAEEKSIVLRWETASEIDSLGFNLYRATSIDGERTRMNDELIPSLVNPGSPFGAEYEYMDGTVARRTLYYYWLEDVDIYGKTELHGPEEASVGRPRTIRWPLLRPWFR